MRAKIITLKRARRLRASMTPPEVLLWVRLRRREPNSPIFRRQHAIGSYILDFFCPAASLAVEVDGSSHGHGDQPLHDERRDAWLRHQGIEVVRIAAVSVLRDPDWTADGIRRLAAERAGCTRPLRQSLCGD
jgi:very-short-patch-repair endonuclease